MKFILFLFIFTLVSCRTFKNYNSGLAGTIPLDQFKSKDYTFSVLIYDTKARKYYVYNDSLTHLLFPPASTFKIPNTIIGIESNVISGINFTLPWDSVVRSNQNWNKSQDLKTAFENSTVWYFQEIARRIGENKMNQGLMKIGYCSKDLNLKMDIDKFWLDGNLKVNMVQQARFLSDLATEKLKIKQKTYVILKSIMLRDEINGAKIYSKTGWGVHNNEDVVWNVGYVEKKNKNYVFVTLITTSNYENVDLIKLRNELTYSALKALNIIN